MSSCLHEGLAALWAKLRQEGVDLFAGFASADQGPEPSLLPPNRMRYPANSKDTALVLQFAYRGMVRQLPFEHLQRQPLKAWPRAFDVVHALTIFALARILPNLGAFGVCILYPRGNVSENERLVNAIQATRTCRDDYDILSFPSTPERFECLSRAFVGERAAGISLQQRLAAVSNAELLEEITRRAKGSRGFGTDQDDAFAGDLALAACTLDFRAFVELDCETRIVTVGLAQDSKNSWVEALAALERAVS